MFVQLEGFSSGTIALPDWLVPTADGRVVLCLIRWLSPHPRAILRDKSLRPICVAPLDINHALWKFTETKRALLTDTILDKNLKYYDGNMTERKRLSMLESHASYDLILPETIDYYINCTRCDEESEDNTILETITIPFD